MLAINYKSLFTIATVLCVFIGCTSNTEHTMTLAGNSLPVSTDLAMDSSIIELYRPYKIALDSIMEEVLCYAPFYLEKNKPESRLNNWMADVCFESATKKHSADFCLLNYGGIRASLPKGAIRTKNIYELMPFENKLVIIEIPDTSFTKALNYLKLSGGHPISNIKLTISDRQIVHSLSKKSSVRIVTSDYLANGGDKMFFFKDSISMVKTGLKIRDVLLTECIHTDTLLTTIDNRFVYEH